MITIKIAYHSINVKDRNNCTFLVQ